MVHPIQSAFSHFLAPITSLFGGGQQQQPDINIPAAPPPILPASQPAQAKPKVGGMQQSFLSGAAQAQLPGQSGDSAAGGSAGRTGATLLGS